MSTQPDTTPVSAIWKPIWINSVFNPIYTLAMRERPVQQRGSVPAMPLDHEEDATNPPVQGRQDIVTGAISVAAILMFVGTGSSVLSTTLHPYFEGGAPADRTLVIALLLNVALILFGWRRHRALSQEVQVRAAAEERAHLLASRAVEHTSALPAHGYI